MAIRKSAACVWLREASKMLSIRTICKAYYIDISRRFLRTKQEHIYYIGILRRFLRTKQQHIILY
jgi:hypothetical protein